jgi:hypothetical protein
MNGQATAIQKERDMKMAKVANLEALKTKLKMLKEKDIEIKEKLSQLPTTIAVPVPYRDILKEFNGILPGNVTLTLLSVQDKGKVLKKGTSPSRPQEGESKKDESRELYFTGLAFGSDVNCLTALAHIIERLERSPLFKNARLVSAEENKLYSQPGTGFEIACDINLDNSPSPPMGRGDFSRPDTGEAKASPTSKGESGGLRKEKR